MSVPAVRRPTLEEWFLELQLRAIVREHVHNPLATSFDVSRIRAVWGDRRPPWTAIGVRAVGMLARAHPNLNRMAFRTPIGRRVVDFPYVTVNVPVLLRRSGHVGACLVARTDERTVEEIATQLATFRETELRDLPVGRYFEGQRNTWWNRGQLRLMHWAAYALPWFYVRGGGGGVSVSSLLNHRAAPAVHGVALGPTGLTFTLTAVREEGGRTLLDVGIAMDHTILTGNEVWEGMTTLRRILEGGEGLAPLDPICR